MAAATQSNMSNALIPLFMSEVQRDLPKETVIFNYFEQQKEVFRGSDMRFRVQVRDNPSGGFRAGTRLARPGITRFEWATVGLKRASFSTSIDNMFKELCETGSPEQVLDALQENIDSLKRNGKRKLELAFLGNGDGILAQLNGDHAAGLTTITVKDPEGRSFGGTKHIDEGAFLVLQPEVPGGAVDVIVDSVSEGATTETFTIVSPAGGIPALPDNANVVFGDADGSSYQNNPDGGVQRLFDNSGTYLGLSYNNFNIWKPESFGAVTDDRNWNSSLLRRLMMRPKQIANIEPGQRVLFMHDWVLQEWLDEEILHKEQFVNVKGIYQTGVVKFSFFDGADQLPIETTPAVSHGDVLVLRPKDWKIPTLGEFALVPKQVAGGGSYEHEVPGYDESFVYMVFYGNVYCKKPKAQLRHRGYHVSTGDLPK